MFQALIQKAEGAVGSAVNKVASRAAVAVPLVIAAGFGIAALTVTLTQVYGAALSYTIMAGLFVAVGGITALWMSRNAPEAEPQPEEPATSLAEDVAEFATPLFDRDTIVSLLATAGPIALPALLRLGARNLPLLVIAIIAALFYFGRSIAREGHSEEQPQPNPAE
jgi:hypothetical protein